MNNKEEKNQKERENNSGKIISDPDGSWTGTPQNPNEKPVQDADDL
jgi:hypothetical protein